MSNANHPANPPRPAGRRSLRLLVWLLLLATVGPCAYLEAPREVARWYLAAAQVERAAGHKELADKQLSEAMRWIPDEPQMLLTRAAWQMENGDLESALATCNRVVELRPEDFNALFARSHVLDRLGKEAEALADWKTIDRLSQTRGLSLEELQWALRSIQADRDAGRKAEAYERLRLVIDWSPAEPTLLLARAEWRIQDGEYALALDDCNRAHNLEPEHAETLLLRSQVFQYLGRHSDAVADFKTLDQLSQTRKSINRVVVLNGLAYARALGNVELAEGLKGINEALRSAPKDPAMLDTRGFLLFKQGEYEASLREMEVATPLADSEFQQRYGPSSKPSPQRDTMARNVAVIYYHRSLVLEKLGRNDEAERDRSRARQLIGREPDETLF
jgi:tetratricopeptide (TPR) repeat protein